MKPLERPPELSPYETDLKNIEDAFKFVEQGIDGFEKIRIENNKLYEILDGIAFAGLVYEEKDILETIRELMIPKQLPLVGLDIKDIEMELKRKEAAGLIKIGKEVDSSHEGWQ